MSAHDPIIGKKLGDYRILELLGRGGMARVYKGYDEALDRYAAVKIITSDFVATADETEYKSRFQREARAIARLRHPNIVGIYQFGDLEGLYYMAMVFLDGVDLRTELKNIHEQDKRMPYDKVLQMANHVASALDYAHQQGVVHRDIKPSNIMMTTTGAVLTDFGLALTMQEGTMGDTFGSAHYIAPEQAISSARAVPQSDLYSLGVVLYEALAGKVPFDDPSVMSVALKHLNEPPPPPTLYNPDLPKDLEKVLFKVLSKEPKDRYTTGKELVEALTKGLASIDDDTVEVRTTDLDPNQTLKDLPVAVAAPLPPASSLDSYLSSIKEQSPAAGSTGEPKATVRIAPPAVIAAPPDANPPNPPPPKATPPFTQPISPDQAPKGRSKLPWITGAVALVAIIGIIAFLVLGSGGGDEDDDSDELSAANRTETAIAALPTATNTEEPTNTAVPPTETATDAPTDTATAEASDTPSREPSATRTQAPSDTPTEQATPAPTEEPTDESTEESSTQVAVIPPTATATRGASNTPLPTNTTRPSNTPRPSATATRTASATSTEPAEIQLRYTTQRVILENISSDEQNISGLIFEGDENGRFAAEAWRTGTNLGGNIENFRSQGCVQLVNDPDAALITPCRFYNFWLWRDSPNAHFWLDTDSNTKFFVRLGDEILAECPLAESLQEETICEFAIP